MFLISKLWCLIPKMYLLMQQYLYGVTEAVVQKRSVKKLLLKIS